MAVNWEAYDLESAKPLRPLVIPVLAMAMLLVRGPFIEKPRSGTF